MQRLLNHFEKSITVWQEIKDEVRLGTIVASRKPSSSFNKSRASKIHDHKSHEFNRFYLQHVTCDFYAFSSTGKCGQGASSSLLQRSPVALFYILGSYGWHFGVPSLVAWWNSNIRTCQGLKDFSGLLPWLPRFHY